MTPPIEQRNWYGNLIAWWAHNPVAANLLMVALLAGGLITIFTITKEIWPRTETNNVIVTVPYLGGTPSDVEEGVLLKIEEAIDDLEGIKDITSYAFSGSGSVTAEVESNYDVLEVMDNIKMRVDAITTFPAETERPTYRREVWSQQVIWVSIFGQVDERTLKEIARQVRDDVTALPSVTRAGLQGARDYEISIEVSEENLRRYGLTLGQVAQAVRQSSLDLPSGRIRAAGGDILVRAIGQAYTGRDFEDIVVRTNPDGSRVLLKDIAEINDGFVDYERYATFNGEPAISVRVEALGEQNALAVAREVRDYVDAKQKELPPGIGVEWWADTSYYLADRLNMMVKNLLMGAVLVFLILTLFLRLKLAFWVMVGLGTAFMGALFTLPMFGISINLVSLFAFIVVLGIVVDDAIIMGESAYTNIREHGHSADNVVTGVMNVAVPATFGVLTTMAAFMPMLMVSGMSRGQFLAIGGVVVICLFYSLVESKLILPAHLAHMRTKQYETDTNNRFIRFQRGFSDGLYRFVDNFYLPSLKVLLRHRYLVLAGFISMLILAVGLIAGGLIRANWNPEMTGDFMSVNLEMQEGTPSYLTNANLEAIQAALRAVDAELQEELGLEQPLVRALLAWSWSDIYGELLVELVKTETIEVSTREIERRWRAEIGEIPGARVFQIGGPGGGGNRPDISFQLVGRDLGMLQAAAAELESRIREYDGVFDIRNSFEGGLREMQLHIKPEAEVLGLSQTDLARQVRQAFYGEEVQRIQRGQDEVRVMVRYPREQRRSEGYMEDMRIRTPEGQEVPFSAVAEVVMGSSPARIQRYNRQRSISISARVDKDIAEAGPIMNELQNTHMPEIFANYPGVNYRLSGWARDQEEMKLELLLGAVLTLLLIYALIAVPLKSYLQPVLIMSVIPFGAIGAILGHMLMGMPISFFSAFGIIALAGVVVNDSLILVDFVNRHRRAGADRVEAAINATRARFRAIVLTSLTTFLGLAPIVFLERSLQAQLVQPMAVALAFGIVFATVITLILIPSLYLIGDDVVRAIQRLFGNRQPHGMVAAESR